MIHAVIMAGGSGTRFWPRSRAKTPKQLLNITGGRTMIQMTVDRLASLVPRQRVLVVTNIQQAEAVYDQLPDVPKANIIAEPVGRNTAPCIGLAALHLLRVDPEAVMVVLAADHLITPETTFCETVRFAADVAMQTNACVTLGMVPTRPETGYGYIQYLEQETLIIGGRAAYKVKTFAEKPNFATAQRFLESGDFVWNSGMFIWKASVILDLIAEFMPELYDGLSQIRPTLGTAGYEEAVARVYRAQKSVSIDYGVMEHAANVYVIKGDFTWNDVGSWEEVYQLSAKDDHGNAVTGDSVLIDTAESMVYAPGKTVALIGVRDLVVVDTGDGLLICHRHRVQDVKKVTDELKQRGKNELL